MSQIEEWPDRSRLPIRFSADETLDIGEDTGTPVVRDYDVPFRFTATLHKVVIQR
ncbi:MAG TPA: hypothetical protein VGM94_00065 [Galbitalea sp.]|jgi:arylsulfatase